METYIEHLKLSSEIKLVFSWELHITKFQNQ